MGRGAGDDGMVRIGITSFAQDALGDVVYVSLPAVGDTVAAGDACGEVESTKSVSDLYAPLAGEVTASTPALDAHPRAGQHRPLRRGLDVRAPPRGRRRRRAASWTSPAYQGSARLTTRGDPGARRLGRTGRKACGPVGAH